MVFIWQQLDDMHMQAHLCSACEIGAFSARCFSHHWFWMSSLFHSITLSVALQTTLNMHTHSCARSRMLSYTNKPLCVVFVCVGHTVRQGCLMCWASSEFWSPLTPILPASVGCPTCVSSWPCSCSAAAQRYDSQSQHRLRCAFDWCTLSPVLLTLSDWQQIQNKSWVMRKCCGGNADTWLEVFRRLCLPAGLLY